MKDKEVCKISICLLTYKTLDPKYNLRSKRKVLENKYDHEQENSKLFIGSLTTKIHHIFSNKLTCIQVRKR
jgi:hypothetical protein